MQVLGVAPVTTLTVDLAARRPLERPTALEDWTVDGVALRRLVADRWGVDDLPSEMSRLWPEDPSAAVASLRALLGEGPGDLEDGRVALLVCPVDQDVDCSALTTRVLLGEDTVEWQDVGWQVDVEPFVPVPDEYGPLLQLRFDRAQYERLLRELLTAYERRAAEQGATPRSPHRSVPAGSDRSSGDRVVCVHGATVRSRRREGATDAHSSVSSGRTRPRATAPLAEADEPPAQRRPAAASSWA